MTVQVCLFARILLCPSQGQNACKERMMLVVLALMQPKAIRMSSGCPIPWPYWTYAKYMLAQWAFAKTPGTYDPDTFGTAPDNHGTAPDDHRIAIRMAL